LFRDSEIGNLADSIQVDQDIIALEISMPDMFTMKVFESFENLFRKVLDQVGFESGLAGGSVDSGDGSTRYIFKETNISRLPDKKELTYIERYSGLVSNPR
jgi:hypothetical protein